MPAFSPFHIWIDVVASILFVTTLGNTVAGLTAAIFGSLVLSLVLWYLHRTRWSQVLVREVRDGRRHWVWVDVPPLGLSFRRPHR